ncbi:hypothetical protein AcW2_001088 [Taiwanofungus camphoratus]|nr:hypothetical protein AcW2_001088 [Antrodia cinnamomea]
MCAQVLRSTLYTAGRDERGDAMQETEGPCNRKEEHRQQRVCRCTPVGTCGTTARALGAARAPSRASPPTPAMSFAVHGRSSYAHGAPTVARRAPRRAGDGQPERGPSLTVYNGVRPAVDLL